VETLTSDSGRPRGATPPRYSTSGVSAAGPVRILRLDADEGVAVGRKNWMFIGSVAAGYRAADLMSLVSSAAPGQTPRRSSGPGDASRAGADESLLTAVRSAEPMAVVCAHDRLRIRASAGWLRRRHGE